MLACRNYPIVYLNMPASAAARCKNLLYRLDTGADYPNPAAIGTDTAIFLRAHGKTREAFAQALAKRKIAFTFVKEPFARCYDDFNQRIAASNQHGFPRVRRIMAARFGADFGVQPDDVTRERHSNNFAAFLRFVRANRAGRTRALAPSQHWLSQKSILKQYQPACAVDFVGRAENFQLGMQYVLHMSGYRGDLSLGGDLGEGPAPAFALDEIMTDQIHAKLHELYDEDLVEFGYRCPRCRQAAGADLHEPGGEPRPAAEPVRDPPN